MAKAKSERLARDFPISQETRLILVSNAFEGDAARVYDEV